MAPPPQSEEKVPRTQIEDGKKEIRRTLENGLGYYDTELTKNRRDWKEVFDFIPSGDFKLHSDHDKDSLPKTHNQWPSSPPALRILNLVQKKIRTGPSC